jgi:GNAT superfamily N-acetyltransferase
MPPNNLLDFERQASQALAALLQVDPREVEVEAQDPIDLIVRAHGRPFLLEYKGRGDDLLSIERAIRQLRRHAAAWPGSVPVVCVPYVGERGRALCAAEGMSWMDLAGNADLTAPGLRIRILGQPKPSVETGRPSTPFAPKSARTTRWLMLHPDRRPTQRELARATDMTEGFTSRIVQRLRAEGHVRRTADGRLEVPDRARLLEAWRDEARFEVHQVLRGHVYARSGEALLHRLADTCREQGLSYAATGLPAAWLMAPFADFRTVTLYLEAPPSARFLEGLGFNANPRGANTWLVVPADEGVFEGAAEWRGVRCVSPIQVYLDLKDQPERAAEAAQELRQTLIEPNL